MSLNLFLNSIAEEFSGREFTSKDLLEFVTGESMIGAGTGLNDGEQTGKSKKKVKKAPKKIKMTVRHYFMTQEKDVYKVKITERVEENKAHNKQHAEKIESGDEDPRPENFLKVLKIVMDELTEEHLQEIQGKVDKYNQEHGFGESEDSE